MVLELSFIRPLQQKLLAVAALQLLIGAGGQRLLFLTAEDGSSPLHAATMFRQVDVSRLLVERGWKRLLAAKANQGNTAEDTTTQYRHWALAGMQWLARVAKARLNVWGQVRPCVLAEVEALAAARAAAAMAELLAEEAKQGGASGLACGSGGGGAARGRKGRVGLARRSEGLHRGLV